MILASDYPIRGHTQFPFNEMGSMTHSEAFDPASKWDIGHLWAFARGRGLYPSLGTAPWLPVEPFYPLQKT